MAQSDGIEREARLVLVGDGREEFLEELTLGGYERVAAHLAAGEADRPGAERPRMER
jgi:hypothetical protein